MKALKGALKKARFKSFDFYHLNFNFRVTFIFKNEMSFFISSNLLMHMLICTNSLIASLILILNLYIS